MAFLESPRFPDDISYGATGGPIWKTEVVQTAGGREYRISYWAQALRHYDVAHAARIATLYSVLRAYFHSVQGKFNAFRFRDWSDYAAASSEGSFALLTATTFQMYRTYTTGTLTHQRIIQKPTSGTITITGGTSPTIDYTTGIVTVSGGTPTAWAGEYDVPCRFDADDAQWEILESTSMNRVIGWRGIGISEVRL
jgi:uncharacterized protein (TIGR02217 family)